MFKTQLFLLGAHITVLCKHKSTHESLNVYFEGALTQKVCSYDATPDYVIRIADDHFYRELIRGRSPDFGPLHGVSVAPRGNTPIDPWTNPSAPLPPTAVGVLNARFVGLHAATVMNENGACCVLVGERGSGKSTLSVLLARDHDNILLSDEETLIHSRSLFVEPFPRAVHVGTSENKKVLKSYAAAGLKSPTQGGIIRFIFLLLRSPGVPVSIVRIGPEQALVGLLKHQRAWGSRPLDSYATAIRLAAQCQVFTCPWSDFETLVPLAREINDIFQARQKRGSGSAP